MYNNDLQGYGSVTVTDAKRNLAGHKREEHRMNSAYSKNVADAKRNSNTSATLSSIYNTIKYNTNVACCALIGNTGKNRHGRSLRLKAEKHSLMTALNAERS